MDQKAIEELREKYIKNPPEGMTAQLVKNMSDSDLLDMHYFLTEDEYFDGEEYKFTEKEIVGLNKKLLGRCQNEYFCVPCLCEMLEINVVSLHERLHRFKEQGCELF